ncbi:Shikimate kinase/gluconokinase [Dillenia turbinata]|uniref:shikimate kinase n=1 Tax=Dillenia turbinata TaxID=194707 RepID=A0AAN8W2B3_9MAGN
MGAASGTTSQLCPPWNGGAEKISTKRKPYSFLRCNVGSSFHALSLSDLEWRTSSFPRNRFALSLSHACKEPEAPALESGNFHACFDSNWFLKMLVKLQKKAEEVAPYLTGCCIYLVGMMGSGKTTVGKILAEALGYSFVDSDKLVEQSVGGSSVAQIFSQYGETFFRDNESEELRKLSLARKQVVATGGGSVVRPVNWKYMKQGITVWLDVPLDALARRIATVGTDTRPLLHFESGDPYTQAFVGLFMISKKRGEQYANADAKVSIQNIAANSGLKDIADITSTAIAVETLIQIENHLRGRDEMFA